MGSKWVVAREKEAKNLGGKGESKTIAELRRHVNILDRSKQRKLKRKEKYTKLERKYNIKQRGEKVRIEELKQRLQANSVKLKGMNKGFIDIK